MKRTATLFEVSWEVCSKVGGVHTVLATKARSMSERLGESYVVIGPWRLSPGDHPSEFEPDPAFDAFAEGCRAAGVPVQVGRWDVPGKPRAILVEFSGLYARKDEILKALWDRHRVDSLFGGWEYVEPLLFGWAAGIVVERWWRESPQGAQGPAVAQFHEWLAGAGLLRLRDEAPEIGTVFTAHSTVLGRAIAATGVSPEKGLEGRTVEQAAEATGVRAAHSMEAALVRECDVFTAVSDMTSDEARLVHGRAADVVLPNGWDPEVMKLRVGGATRDASARRFRDAASKLLGEDAGDAYTIVTAGRHEMHNKGYDILLAALAEIAQKPGRRIVLWMFVPAGNAGLRRDVAERLRAPFAPGEPVGHCTHALFDAENDGIAVKCRALGLLNAKGSRVRVIHVASYLGVGDGLFGMGYESLLQGADLTCFPSFYDAWGYTPQESLALGVPTITTDCTGFGQWTSAAGVPRGRGVTVLARKDRSDEKATARLVRAIERRLDDARDRETVAASCREIAASTEWTLLVERHFDAHAKARETARKRSRRKHVPAAPAPAHPLPARPAAPPNRPRLFPLDVTPAVPAGIADLARIARNLRWTWDAEAASLFADLSPQVFDACRHDAVRTLREASQADLDARAADPEYAHRVKRVARRLDADLSAAAAAADAEADGPSRRHPVAYVCAEFGIHESLPIYSGGLGALAGDHLKTAADLRFPLVGVGLLYRRGYMRQRLDGGTDQRAVEDVLDPAASPLAPVLGADGKPVEVSLQIPGTKLLLRAWKLQVGTVELYLLDSDTDGNRAEDRAITHALYSGDAEHRLRQEIVLGAGGARLLAAIGIEPSAWHVNEGHGAFCALERARVLVKEKGLSFDEAREAVRATTVFTTHTPVPAGHDRFAEDLMRRYFSDVPEWLGIPWERFFALGVASDDAHGFNMTKLAIEFASVVNAVSEKHGEVSRSLLRSFQPALLTGEVPVASVTNGVHLPTWTSPAVAKLLGASGAVAAEDFRRRAPQASDAALWAVRSSLRDDMRRAVAARVTASFRARGDSEALLARTVEGLSPDALYIGFARRFATYKRADLVLRDPARLAAILDAPGRPVRLLVAGKAHPRDGAARDLLSRVAKLARSDAFAGRIVILEDYDLALARTLVRGVDVWLNNPRAPLEASGTSGMKAAANGALNLSVGDGWWLEAFDGTNGWRIGPDFRTAPVPADEGAQDVADAAALYTLLEHEVVPSFFDRGADGVPASWCARVRRALATVPPVFDTARMVAQYAELAYRPLARRFHELREDDFAGARALAARRARVHAGMAALRVVAARVAGAESARPGDALAAEVDVNLGTLLPGDVVVEMVLGERRGDDDLDAREIVVLQPARPIDREDGSAPAAGGLRRYAGTVTVSAPGRLAYGVRVRPAGITGAPGDERPTFHDPVVWA
ncbi:MAG: hypothetical protein HMLKMBBP_01150 [Planctomycetes bacterium]|nr:hypothetical protein [Planctomycetota bacterium]